jgi:hypothetical protein
MQHQPNRLAPDPEEIDRHRVAESFRARLRGRGIAPHESDSLDDLGLMLEAIECFELEVILHGGDLMVDEPPPGQPVVPDNPYFALPRRGSNEAAGTYAKRVEAAILEVRRQRRVH